MGIYSDYHFSQAESREEELGALKRKADYLGRQAQVHLAREEKEDDENDASEDYYELVSLAQRLSTVSEQLKEQATKLNQPGLMLASENAHCLSMRLKEKAEQLRNLCVNAKTWEGDIKRAGANLRRRLDAAKPKKVAIEVV